MQPKVVIRLASRRSVAAVGVALLAALAGTGVGGASAARAAPKAASGGIASYALEVGEHFSWMLPLENQVNYQVYDGMVEDGMWLPLYAAGKGSATGIDYGRSIGKKPVYSDGDKVVTVTMNRGFTWSDGTKVTTTDVKFFFDLVAAGKHTLGEYIPGELPDDITSVDYPSPYRLVLHLNRAYSPTWFTDNQLTWIIPMPAQAWDKTCSTCPVGSEATTPTGAKAVFDFLFKQSESATTYATNPMWKTVDGPWVISSFDAVTYHASFAANAAYSGPTKPKLAGYELFSFTTPTSELDALRSGAITFGYLPQGELKQISYFKSHGFTVKNWSFFYNMAIELGYTSKTWGPLVKQLYIRQALQHLVNQDLYITRTLHGYGLPDYGPVADYPGSPYVAPAIQKDPYPYDPAAAKTLLAKHGWAKGANGVDVCKHPGDAADECGPGIAKGKALTFRFMYESGTTSFFAQVSAFETVARSVGIGITLDAQALTTMYTIDGVCPSSPPCDWGLAGYAGYLWPYSENTILPTGKNEFGAGNFWAGGYTSGKAQRLIDAADQQPGLQRLYADEEYLSKQVASLWWPLADEVVVVKHNLKGWEQLSPYGTIHPSTWYFKS
jgi:peptide/nickel transport system substrate-binding protein